MSVRYSLAFSRVSASMHAYPWNLGAEVLVHATVETNKMKKITSIERNPGPEEYYEI